MSARVWRRVLAGWAGAAFAAAPLAAQDAPEMLPPEELYNDNYDEALPLPTRVLSPPDLVRLAAPKGITLQWIDWNQRGEVRTLVDGDGVWRLVGSQTGPGDAYVGVDGIITAISENAFMLSGTIRIENTPDAGRSCEATADWRFEITQNRRYYRLRQFEWCDDLTDYIDIYF